MNLFKIAEDLNFLCKNISLSVSSSFISNLLKSGRGINGSFKLAIQKNIHQMESAIIAFFILRVVDRKYNTLLQFLNLFTAYFYSYLRYGVEFALRKGFRNTLISLFVGKLF